LRDFAPQLDPSLTLFEVVLFETAGDQWAKNTGLHHNPKREF
jgi:hypothetical protein